MKIPTPEKCTQRLKKKITQALLAMLVKFRQKSSQGRASKTHADTCLHKTFQNLRNFLTFERGTCKTGTFSYFFAQLDKQILNLVCFLKQIQWITLRKITLNSDHTKKITLRRSVARQSIIRHLCFYLYFFFLLFLVNSTFASVPENIFNFCQAVKECSFLSSEGQQ